MSSGNSNSAQDVRQRLQLLRPILNAVLESDLFPRELDDVREKLLGARVVLDDTLRNETPSDSLEERTACEFIVASLHLWLAQQSANELPCDRNLKRIVEVEGWFQQASQDYWDVVGVTDNVESGLIPEEESGPQLQEFVESNYSLAHFEDIRQVRLRGRTIEVLGSVPLEQLRPSERTDAIAFASDGYVFAVETYSVADEAVEFHGIRFEQDPWLNSANGEN